MAVVVDTVVAIAHPVDPAQRAAIETVAVDVAAIAADVSLVADAGVLTEIEDQMYRNHFVPQALHLSKR